MRRRIFIGSSTEALPVAQALQTNLQRSHEPTIWTQDSFPPGKSVIESLEQVLDSSDAGVFVLTPDDLVKLREKVQPTARDNVIFEMGLFIGRFGRDRTFMVVPRSCALRRPSDLDGILAAEYDDERRDGNLVASVATASTQVCDALAKAERRRSKESAQLPSHVGLPALQERTGRTICRLLTRPPGTMFTENSIRNVKGGVAIRLGWADITVLFGRIEASDTDDPCSVIALPANEFFDDDCINDSHSSLGAYMQHVFRERTDEITRLVKSERSRLTPAIVESEAGRYQESYGIGNCIYLNRPLGTERKIILAAVTTKRAGLGLRCYPQYLYAAVREINKVINDHRLSDLTVPVMGSGHGGVPAELALLHTLLAISAVVNDFERSHMKRVNIIVFQPDARNDPSIPRAIVRQTLALVANTFE